MVIGATWTRGSNGTALDMGVEPRYKMTCQDPLYESGLHISQRSFLTARLRARVLAMFRIFLVLPVSVSRASTGRDVDRVAIMRCIQSVTLAISAAVGARPATMVR